MHRVMKRWPLQPDFPVQISIPQLSCMSLGKLLYCFSKVEMQLIAAT